MTELDLEAIIVGLSQDAALIGCASADRLKPHQDLIENALDELTRALEKARQRIAA